MRASALASFPHPSPLQYYYKLLQFIYLFLLQSKRSNYSLLPGSALVDIAADSSAEQANKEDLYKLCGETFEPLSHCQGSGGSLGRNTKIRQRLGLDSLYCLHISRRCLHVGIFAGGGFSLCISTWLHLYLKG